MIVPFDTLSQDSRVWVFQSHRFLAIEEVSVLTARLEGFLGNWASHGSEINSAYSMMFNCFLIIGVDGASSGASGCSVDKLTYIIQELGRELGTDFLDRGMVAVTTKDEISLIPSVELIKKIKIGAIESDYLVFDNTVMSKGAFQTNWLKPIGQSWLKKYIPVNQS